MQHLKKYSIYYLLGLLNLIYILIRLPDFYRPLWSDELISIRTTNVNPLNNPLYDGVSTNLPLFYYFIKIFSFFFTGENLRITSLIFSIVILNLFLYRYLKEKNNYYLIASVLITFSPIQIYYSTELRTYMFTQLLLIIQFYFLVDYLNKKKTNYFFWAITIFLSLISHYTSYIFVFSVGLYLIFKEKKLSEALLKAFIFPSILGFLVLISVSGNYGFSDSTERSILNLNFERFTIFNLKENFLRLIEVVTIYYNFGLHYYRLDELFTSLFKKSMYFFFLIPVIWIFLKSKFQNQILNLTATILTLCLFFAILFDLSGFIAFAGRYIFPFNFIYILFISIVLNEILKIKKIYFLLLLMIFIISYNLYNTCLFHQLNIYKGNEDPQGRIIQNCFK